MSMYTQTDLDEALAARRKLINGHRVTRSETGGKDREFQAVKLKDLSLYIQEIRADLATATGGCFNKVQFNDPS